MGFSTGLSTVTIELPSLGLLYEEKLPGGLVKVKSLTTRDEKILGDTRKFVDILNTYLERSLELPQGLKVLDLLTGDRLFALFAIRALSYGPDYSFEYRCEACGKPSKSQIMIPDLEAKKLPLDAAEPFKIELPKSGDQVEFRLFRGHDEVALERRMDTKNARESIKVFQLARSLVSVNGKEVNQSDPIDSQNARDYIGNLIPWDTNALQDAMDDVDPGIALEHTAYCTNPMCMRETTLSVPIQAEFFRPTRRKSR